MLSTSGDPVDFPERVNAGAGADADAGIVPSRGIRIPMSMRCDDTIGKAGETWEK
jgi:hypothetical protein